MCGEGEHGRLGLGDEDDRTTPMLVARAVFDGEAVLMVACGEEHTAAVTEGGGVYAFGYGGLLIPSTSTPLGMGGTWDDTRMSTSG